MVRLFVCIWVPDDLRKSIVELQEKLMRLKIKSKFIEKESFHLTITFLGDISENEIPEIKNKLDETANKIKKFYIKLGKLVLIPSERYIRVIGIRAEDNKNISELIKVVSNSIGGSFHDSTKLTVCRVKSIPDKSKLINFIKAFQDISIGEFLVENVSLVKSTLTKTGPIYHTIHDSPLS